MLRDSLNSVCPKNVYMCHFGYASHGFTAPGLGNYVPRARWKKLLDLFYSECLVCLCPASCCEEHLHSIAVWWQRCWYKTYISHISITCIMICCYSDDFLLNGSNTNVYVLGQWWSQQSVLKFLCQPGPLILWNKNVAVSSYNNYVWRLGPLTGP